MMTVIDAADVPVRKTITVNADLEHRNFNCVGPGGETIRVGVNAAGGWGSLLEGFKAVVETV